MEIALRVNGREVVRDVEPQELLLDLLRDSLGLTGAKRSCDVQVCGACTVLVDGEPRRSCLLPLTAIDGAQVMTAEGLGEPGNLSVVQAAFHEQYGTQCGFCTPGFVMATTALLERNPSPSRDEILEELGGHVCRCTGYRGIVEAVAELAGVA